MHVVGVARTDQRVLREATALRDAGFDVTIVDVEPDPNRPRQEDFQGLHLRHIIMPSRFRPTRFKPFFIVKEGRLTLTAGRVMAGIPAEATMRTTPTRCERAPWRPAGTGSRSSSMPTSCPTSNRARRSTSSTRRIATRGLRGMMRHCAAVITISQPVADDLRHRYGGKPAVLVRNMLRYTPPVQSDRMREALGLPASTRIALYQGNLQADRGLDRLVRAGHYLTPNRIIALMGSGPEEAMLRELVEKENLGDRVKILPAVPYAELLAWTASADLGLIIYPLSYSPNVNLCLPNKLFEFLMAGLPVLASPLVAVQEMLERYDVGQIVQTVEPEPMGKAISAMLDDTDGLSRMRRNALAASRMDLSWEHEQHRLVDLYTGLTGSSHPGATVGTSVSARLQS